MNLTDLFGVGTKLKKKYSTTNIPVPLLKPEHGFCQQHGPECGKALVSEWKNSGGFRLFEWQMLLLGCLGAYRINKNKGDDSLSLLAFWRHVGNVIFLKLSKEGRLSSSNLGIWNIPSDVW